MVIVADQHPTDMRNHQTDPADRAADAHRGSGTKRCPADHKKLAAAHIQPEGSRFAFSHGKHVEPPARQENQKDTERHGDKRKQMGIADRSKRSHKPEGDARQLAVGVGDVFHDGDERAEKRADNCAAKDHCDGRGHAGDAAGEPAEYHRSKGKHKRKQIGPDPAAEADDGDAGAEARAVGNAEDAGADERVAEHALKRRAGHGQRRTHKRGGQRPRQPQLPHGDARRKRHAPRPDDCSQHVARRQRIASEKQRRRNKQNRQHKQRRNQHCAAYRFCCSGSFHCFAPQTIVWYYSTLRARLCQRKSAAAATQSQVIFHPVAVRRVLSTHSLSVVYR